MKKLALDYDDTIDQNYPFFSELTAALKEAGWEIHIVTHIYEEHRAFRTQQLKDYDITYDVLACTGEKLKYCQDHGIEYIFDDVRDYFHSTGLPPAYLLLHTIPLKETIVKGPKKQRLSKDNGGTLDFNKEEEKEIKAAFKKKLKGKK